MNIALEVSDLDASARFYTEAIGLTFREAPEVEAGDPWLSGPRRIAVDERGLPRLSLRVTQGRPSSGIELGFGVGHLGQAHDRAVKAGAKVLHPPRRERFGPTARYQDPDGNVVALSELERPLWPLLKTMLFWALAIASAAALWLGYEAFHWVNG